MYKMIKVSQKQSISGNNKCGSLSPTSTCVSAKSGYTECNYSGIVLLSNYHVMLTVVSQRQI